MKLYKNVYLCHSCEKYLTAAEFLIPANSRTIGRCRSCYQLDNEARQREAYFKYRLILENLRESEVGYQDDSKIVFLVQVLLERALLLLVNSGFDYMSFILCMFLTG